MKQINSNKELNASKKKQEWAEERIKETTSQTELKLLRALNFYYRGIVAGLKIGITLD